MKESQTFAQKILPYLNTYETKIVTRLISGKIRLNEYMHSIEKADHPWCDECMSRDDEYKYETVEHFIWNCKATRRQRKRCFKQMTQVIGSFDERKWNIYSLLAHSLQACRAVVYMVRDIARLL